MRAEDIWKMSSRDLAALIANGHRIAHTALPGNYRGVSLGLPAWIDAIAWKVFRKSFQRDPDRPDRIIGHNVRMQQPEELLPLHASPPPKPILRGGRPLTFGPFAVRALPEHTPFHCRAGLLLDYGASHPFWHPLARLRDPIVAIQPDSVDLLLGASYLSLGLSVRTPSYFTLERET